MNLPVWQSGHVSSLDPPHPVTYFPPLSPLYRFFLGNVDEHNVAFHQAHHRFGRGNYGITQWLDYALGTALPQHKLDRGVEDAQHVDS